MYKVLKKLCRIYVKHVVIYKPNISHINFFEKDKIFRKVRQPLVSFTWHVTLPLNLVLAVALEMILRLNN